VSGEEPLEAWLEKDPEGAELLSFHKRIFANAESMRLRGRDFVEAVGAPPSVAAAMFGYSTEEWMNMFAHLQELARSIRARYPEIDELVDQGNWEHCKEIDLYEFARVWDEAMARAHGGPAEVQARAPERGQVLLLVAGLIICAITAGER